MTAYQGDTDAKRCVRIRYWKAVRAWLGADFLTLKHVVLASQDAGDVSVLGAMGVSPKNIVAVDRRADALVEARKANPAARYVHGEVDAVLARLTDVGSVFFDFCGWASAANVATVVSAARRKCVCEGGVIGVAVMRGRERKEMSSRIDCCKSMQPLRNDIRNRFSTLLTRTVPGADVLDHAHVDEARLALLCQDINNGILPMRRAVFPIFAATYWGRHTPMIVSAYTLHKASPGRSITWGKMQADFMGSCLGVRPVPLWLRGRNTVTNIHIRRNDDARAALVCEVEGEPNAAALANLTVRELAARRALNTMKSRDEAADRRVSNG